MDWTETGNTLIAGIATGSIYALIALGYSVMYSATRVVNFAHGEFFMAGGMLAAFFLTEKGWGILPTVLVVVVLGASGGLLLHLVAVRPILRRQTIEGTGFSSHIGWLLSTFAAAILLQGTFSLALGPDPRAVKSLVPARTFRWGDVRVKSAEMLIIGSAIAATLLLYLLLRRTLLGRALEAVAEDSDAARLRGIPVAYLALLAFAVGSALAVVAGLLASPVTSAYPTIGVILALKGFIAAAIGGLGDVRGALVGGVVLGVVELLSVQYVGPGYRNVAVFAVLIVFLVVRQQGLFGPGQVRRV